MFADELNVAGIPAVALSGAQAGILTDDRFGDARIVSVEPHRLWTPSIAAPCRSSPATKARPASGATTTLGRGGTDLSAIAIGHALDAERIDIYTDVSGAMTADPRRMPEARTIERASLDEMSELAQHGAKVMHIRPQISRAAPVRATRSRASIPIAARWSTKARFHRTSRNRRDDCSGRLTWVRIIRGDIETPSRRMQTELEMFVRLADAGISIDQVTINQAGVAFVVEGDSRRGDCDACWAISISPSAVRGGLFETLGGRHRHARYPGVVRTSWKRSRASTSKSFTLPTATSRYRFSSRPAMRRAPNRRFTNSSISTQEKLRHETRHDRTAMITPFDERGDLEIAEAARMASWLIERGNEGLVVAGSTGEGQTLDRAERSELVGRGKRRRRRSCRGHRQRRHEPRRANRSHSREERGRRCRCDYSRSFPVHQTDTKRDARHFGAIAEAATLADRRSTTFPVATGTNMLPETLLQTRQRSSHDRRRQRVERRSRSRSRRSARSVRDGFMVWSGDDHLFLAELGVGRRRRRRRRVASVLARVPPDVRRVSRRAGRRSGQDSRDLCRSSTRCLQRRVRFRSSGR